MAKAILIFLMFFPLIHLFAEIDESSFKNTKRYIFLKEQHAEASDKIHVYINFIPPKGKKVNSASFVKLWEKNGNNWKLVEKLEPTVDVFNETTNVFDAYFTTANKNFPLALEVEFIHCEKYGGGQCAMERYLGKIQRVTRKTTSALKYKLKI